MTRLRDAARVVVEAAWRVLWLLLRPTRPARTTRRRTR